MGAASSRLVRRDRRCIGPRGRRWVVVGWLGHGGPRPFRWIAVLLRGVDDASASPAGRDGGGVPRSVGGSDGGAIDRQGPTRVARSEPAGRGGPASTSRGLSANARPSPPDRWVRPPTVKCLATGDPGDNPSLLRHSGNSRFRSGRFPWHGRAGAHACPVKDRAARPLQRSHTKANELRAGLSSFLRRCRRVGRLSLVANPGSTRNWPEDRPIPIGRIGVTHVLGEHPSLALRVGDHSPTHTPRPIGRAGEPRRAKHPARRRPAGVGVQYQFRVGWARGCPRQCLAVLWA